MSNQDNQPTKDAPAETLRSGDLLAVRGRSYSYDDMLAAWIAGRDNERLYGNASGDVPDFATWIRRRIGTANSSSETRRGK